MHTNLKYGLPVLAAIFAMFTATDASAQQQRELNVTAQVPEVCVIVSPATINMDFGTLDPANGTDDTVTVDFEYRCSQGTQVEIGLGLGSGTGATLAKRFMTHTNGTDALGYRLEKATDSSDWGEVGTATSYTDIAAGLGSLEQVTIRGIVASADKAAAPVGDYSDTVTIILLP